VINYARAVDTWMRAGGRAEIAKHLRIAEPVKVMAA
jgi:hypothetical protein